MSKIIYFGNFLDTAVRTIDSEIYSSFTNHEVKCFDIKNFDMKELLDACEKADLFLFHGLVIADNDINYLLMIERLKMILMNVKCKKVLWYMDKVWSIKAQVVDALLPLVDYAYFVDGTWVRRTKEKNIEHLPPAHTDFKGEFKPELACDIAYVGKMYGTRTEEYSYLKETFGERIKFHDNKYGQELADLCASAKIMIIPRFPFDDFYWSDRIYEYLNNGAFVICPRAHGLTEEGFEDRKHYMSYHNDSEIVTVVMEMLENEKLRKEIAEEGKKFVKGITYKSRIKEIMKNL
jgi:hypothetical protein